MRDRGAGEQDRGQQDMKAFHRLLLRYVRLLFIIAENSMRSPHDARYAARFAARPGHALLQEAARRRPKIARPHIGPRAAALFGLAGLSAHGAGRVGLHIQVLEVPSGAIDREFNGAALALEHARALHARHATGVLDARSNLVLEPAHRARRCRAWIGEAPGAAPPFPLAARRAG